MFMIRYCFFTLTCEIAMTQKLIFTKRLNASMKDVLRLLSVIIQSECVKDKRLVLHTGSCYFACELFNYMRY